MSQGEKYGDENGEDNLRSENWLDEAVCKLTSLRVARLSLCRLCRFGQPAVTRQAISVRPDP